MGSRSARQHCPVALWSRCATFLQHPGQTQVPADRQDRVRPSRAGRQTTCALVRQDVAFVLMHNGRQVFVPTSPPTAAATNDACRTCWDRRSPSTRCIFEYEAAGLRLAGWVARPAFSRSQGDMQHFYVNRRMVRDKLVGHAVRQAFPDVLYHGRHPAMCCFWTSRRRWWT